MTWHDATCGHIQGHVPLSWSTWGITRGHTAWKKPKIDEYKSLRRSCADRLGVPPPKKEGNRAAQTPLRHPMENQLEPFNHLTDDNWWVTDEKWRKIEKVILSYRKIWNLRLMFHTPDDPQGGRWIYIYIYIYIYISVSVVGPRKLACV